MSLVTWIPDRIREYRQRHREAEALLVENDAKARDLQTDLDRWVRDRGRRLNEDLAGIVNRASGQL